MLQLQQWISFLKNKTNFNPSDSQQKQNDLQKKLAKIRNDLEKEGCNFAKSLENYSKLVDAYYLKYPPFGTKDFHKDFEDFIEIVGHSLVVGNYSLINKWAIDFPLKNWSRLAKKPHEYLERFDYAVSKDLEYYKNNRDWPEEAKYYLKYLIQEWRKNPNLK